jgi:ATP-binding protein involved in chromosome partitioning
VSRLRTYHELTGEDRSGLGAQVEAQQARIASRLASVRNVVAVMSGKGGVGKSFVTAGLAAGLARAGRTTGILDADLHGPTVARMVGATGPLEVGDDGVSPAVTHDGLLEAAVLREFLADVRWGALDVLLVDLPPGRDRLDALVELLPRPPGIVVVSIPSEASFRAVRRAVAAAREACLPIYGIVENMAGYRCAGCAAEGALFRGDAGERLAREAGAPLLARVPFDPRVQDAVDAGDPSGAAAALAGAASSLLSRLEAS